MKPFGPIALYCLLGSVCLAAEVPPEIENERITGINKLLPRGNHWPQPVEDVSKIDPADAVESVLPGDQPGWTDAVVERLERMVIRNRQHPRVAT